MTYFPENIIVETNRVIVFGWEVEMQRDKKLFCLVKKKDERMENVVCINYYIYSLLEVKKSSFRQMRFMLGWGPRLKLNNGLEARPKGYW